jgi:hypothetical protein
MAAWLIWSTALAAYALFRLWYDNWQGPLTPAEIDAFMAEVAGKFHAGGNDPAAMRAFLEADDGREFVMLNLIRVEPGEVADPATGKMVPGMEMMRRYSRRFMAVLVRRGGHPGMVARKVGGYIDAWNTAPDPGWTLFGLMRYRSRRDLVRLALDPEFREGHPEKVLGAPVTFSFPAQRELSLYAGPRLTVALVLALAAALAHLTLLTVFA